MRTFAAVTYSRKSQQGTLLIYDGHFLCPYVYDISDCHLRNIQGCEALLCCNQRNLAVAFAFESSLFNV